MVPEDSTKCDDRIIRNVESQECSKRGNMKMIVIREYTHLAPAPTNIVYPPFRA